MKKVNFYVEKAKEERDEVIRLTAHSRTCLHSYTRRTDNCKNKREGEIE